MQWTLQIQPSPGAASRVSGPLQYAGLTSDSSLPILSLIWFNQSHSCFQSSSCPIQEVLLLLWLRLTTNTLVILADHSCAPVTLGDTEASPVLKNIQVKGCGLMVLFPRPLYVSIVEASQLWVKLKLPKQTLTLKELSNSSTVWTNRGCGPRFNGKICRNGLFLYFYCCGFIVAEFHCYSSFSREKITCPPKATGLLEMTRNKSPRTASSQLNPEEDSRSNLETG